MQDHSTAAIQFGLELTHWTVSELWVAASGIGGSFHSCEAAFWPRLVEVAPARLVVDQLAGLALVALHGKARGTVLAGRCGLRRRYWHWDCRGRRYYGWCRLALGRV